MSWGCNKHDCDRSTKAGAETPATRLDRRLDVGIAYRSTKAGAETPATHEYASEERTVQPRSTKAGAETPATHDLPHAPDAAIRAQRRPGPRPRRHPYGPLPADPGPSSLNEGRGRDPGDTSRACRPAWRHSGRSTKAGAETPATLDAGEIQFLGSTTAQRRPGPRPRRHSSPPTISPPASPLNEGRGRDPGDTQVDRVEARKLGRRSTKAGAETPATPSVSISLGTMTGSLNEGRGRDPGDTQIARRAS